MKPLILDYVVERVQGPDVSYTYDFARSMSVVQEQGKNVDFIDSDIASGTMGTVTKVKGERANDSTTILQTVTGTRVKGEQNDRQSSLLALATKTLVQRESDD